MRLQFQLIAGLLLLASVAHSTGLVRETYQGARPTGMGNAFIALADDHNAIWYNPAGLAFKKKLSWDVFDFTLGVDSLDTLQRLKRAIFNGDYNNLIRQDTEFIRFNVKQIFAGPYFAFGFYDNIQSFTDFKNMGTIDPLTETYPEVDILAFNDLVVFGSMALPVTPYFSFGATVRGMHRTGVDANVNAVDLLQSVGLSALTDSNAFLQGAYQYIAQLSGSGIGLSITTGALTKIPLGKGQPTLQLGATVENVGRTTFIPFGTTQAPPPLQQSYNAGMALVYPLGKTSQFNFVFDVRHLFEDLPLVKMLHGGFEYRTKAMSVRFGAHQAYPTFGLGIEILPHTKLQISTYASELGDRLYERSQRWYLAHLIVGFNPF